MQCKSSAQAENAVTVKAAQAAFSLGQHRSLCHKPLLLIGHASVADLSFLKVL